ncbi:unnamed protein product [Mytilus edulis]|uniref:Uncharacterized protein n=1 Tax=Mytilus edulis TaxID=6550 RepID=A0A8S3RSK1_MYTED|nr:unnamed protein product [Mytilus edulis]
MKVHNGHEFVDEEEFLSKKKTLWEGHKNAVKEIGELSTAESELLQGKIKESDLKKKKLSINWKIDRKLKKIARKKRKFQKDIKVVDLIKSSKDFNLFFERFDELFTSLDCDIGPLSKSNIGSISDFIEGERSVSKSNQLRTNYSCAIKRFIVKETTTDIRNTFISPTA